MITNQFNKTKMQQFIHNVKLITIGLLLASAVFSFLMYHMESKARDMERNQYKQELDALKGQLEGQSAPLVQNQ